MKYYDIMNLELLPPKNSYSGTETNDWLAVESFDPTLAAESDMGHGEWVSTLVAEPCEGAEVAAGGGGVLGCGRLGGLRGLAGERGEELFPVAPGRRGAEAACARQAGAVLHPVWPAVVRRPVPGPHGVVAGRHQAEGRRPRVGRAQLGWALSAGALVFPARLGGAGGVGGGVGFVGVAPGRTVW